MRRTREAGLTLIELLAIVAIFAILAAVILPNVFGQIEKKKQREKDSWLSKSHQVLVETTPNKSGISFTMINEWGCKQVTFFDWGFDGNLDMVSCIKEDSRILKMKIWLGDWNGVDPSGFERYLLDMMMMNPNREESRIEQDNLDAVWRDRYPLVREYWWRHHPIIKRN